MQHKTFFILALISFISVFSHASALPACPSESDAIWHNCQGTFSFTDGDKYVGEFQNDEMHGQGTYTYLDGDKYVGEFKKGLFNGQGTYTYADGDKYVGEYQNDVRHGQGTYTYADGDKYVGEYQNDVRHGQGTYTYADGDKYVGEYQNDEMHGQGTYTYLDGEEYLGEFKKDLFNGQGILTSPDKTVITGTWKDGILQPQEGLFNVVGNKLYFDTENTMGVDEINFNHADNLFDILKSNNQIQTLILNSEGGMTNAAIDIADLVIDAGLDTHVEENCLSACVTIFLAGNNRSLALGGKIGFHKGYWEASNIKSYYINNKKDEKWADPFEFASWLYEDTQSDVFKAFEYLLERGVKAGFAIKTLKADSDGMWKPRRSELLLGGILTQ